MLILERICYLSVLIGIAVSVWTQDIIKIESTKILRYRHLCYMFKVKKVVETLMFIFQDLFHQDCKTLKTKIIPDCCHFITEEHPELLWKHIADFIRSMAKF